MCFSNYGEVVDLQGWGELVVTTGNFFLSNGTEEINNIDYSNFNQEYTSNFGGTSSASPIVSGAIILLNGIFDSTISAVGNGNTVGIGRRLRANTMRALLKNTGTPQGFIIGEEDRNIGELPNLRNALETSLPIASIEINGRNHGDVVVESMGNNLEITLSLESRGLQGVDADWWVIVDIDGVFYYYSNLFNWTTVPSPIFQNEITNLSKFTLFNGTLPTGTYYIYFGVDTLQNGNLFHILDGNMISEINNYLYFDKVELQVLNRGI